MPMSRSGVIGRRCEVKRQGGDLGKLSAALCDVPVTSEYVNHPQKHKHRGRILKNTVLFGNCVHTLGLASILPDSFPAM